MKSPSKLAVMSWDVFLSLPKVVDKVNFYCFLPLVIA